jgi:hypothetical protein
VSCESLSEYGLDCQSRGSKSCVVNDGALSTEVLGVATLSTAVLNAKQLPEAE